MQLCKKLCRTQEALLASLTKPNALHIPGIFLMGMTATVLGSPAKGTTTSPVQQVRSKDSAHRFNVGRICLDPE